MTAHITQPDVAFTVNGATCTAQPRPGLTLLGHLRGEMGLTGTKVGCASGACGACTVLIDGVAVQSCQVPIPSLEGSAVQTVEALVQTEQGHVIADALITAGAAQCGYCLPGIVTATCAAVAQQGADFKIDEALSRNLCRCGTHRRIVDALRRVKTTLAEDI
jgi:aerobic-type carbon monoxide dehydrogenase small subunit (CoxS/CutS family)